MRKGEPSVTAKLCAFTRAHHAIYTQNPIFNDRYALGLLGQEEYESIQKMIIQILYDRSWQIPTMDNWDSFINNMISPIILSRIKYTEEQLKEFVQSENEPVQYVILGAGLDTFLFRNHDSNIRIFELDHPDTQQYKKQRIEALGWKIPENTHLLPIDFETQSIENVLLDGGYDPEVKSFFSILGVSYYLTLDTFAETLLRIAAIAKGKCRFVFDYPDKEIVVNGHPNQRMEALMDITAYLGEKMKGGMCYKELAEVFDQAGYHISEHVTSHIIQEKYFQNRTDNLNAFENVSFILAERNSNKN